MLMKIFGFYVHDFYSIPFSNAVLSLFPIRVPSYSRNNQDIDANFDQCV
jgi:hypothetical protein